MRIGVSLQVNIVACEMGGFVVYGPRQEAEAFQQNRPLQPLAAFTELDAALSFVRKELSPAASGEVSDRG